MLDALRHLLLPCLALGLPSAAGVALYVRQEMKELLARPFVRIAVARGARPGEIVLRHALKNALLPVVNLIGVALPGLAGGSLVPPSVDAGACAAHRRVPPAHRHASPGDFARLGVRARGTDGLPSGGGPARDARDALLPARDRRSGAGSAEPRADRRAALARYRGAERHPRHPPGRRGRLRRRSP